MLETTVKFDDSDLLKSLTQAEKELTDLTPEMKAAGKVIAARIDSNFRNAKNQYTELAPATIKNRQAMRRRGRSLVAGDEDPLRVTDTLRKAATATESGVEGSAFEVSGNSVTVGIKEPEEGGLKYGRAVLLGRKVPKPMIPARPAIDATDADIEQARGIIERGIENRINRLMR